MASAFVLYVPNFLSVISESTTYLFFIFLIMLAVYQKHKDYSDSFMFLCYIVPRGR